jgi:hypothetical protein
MINLKEEKEVLKTPETIYELNNNPIAINKDLLETQCLCGKPTSEHDEVDEKIDRLVAERDLLVADIKNNKSFIDAERERYNAANKRYNLAEAKIRSLKIQRIKSFFCSLVYYFLGVVTGFYLDSFISVLFTVFKILYSKLVLILGF